MSLFFLSRCLTRRSALKFGCRAPLISKYHINEASTVATTKSSSFSQTLHFITSLKLQELEKQRVTYNDYAKVLEEANAVGEKGDIITKVEMLAKAVKRWTGSGALDESKIVGGELELNTLNFWLQQAKKDPSFSREIAERWAQSLEAHIRHTAMRFDAAKLFGTLFNEWLASGDSNAGDALSEPQTQELGAQSPDAGREEMQEQKAKFESIVFQDQPVDVEKLKAYLEELFTPERSADALKKLRQEMKDHGFWLLRKKIDVSDVSNTIRGLLATDMMGEEKRAALRTFQKNPTVLNELTSVLNMRLAGLETWTWPQEGIKLEMRRQLNGKYRVFGDPEIVDALLLHYIGVSWQIKLKSALKRLFESKAWTPASPPLTHLVKKRSEIQIPLNDASKSIDEQRNASRKEFFLSQLVDSSHAYNSYDEPGVNTKGASTKEKLLHIMATECHLNKALHGTHAIIRSDFEWFGPSLPFDSINTLLEFLGMPKPWLSFFKTFLNAPVQFPGDAEIRVRKRGTPISYSLSVVCGEAVLFFMDYAVNRHAKGLYLYRMHDDLWLWDADPKKCATAWAEMNNCAGLLGLRFNKEKTGSAYVGSTVAADVDLGLPQGDIKWGFLKFEPSQSRFVINQEDIDLHIVELRRQLASTKSVFGWINAYNKYMAFILRNLGGLPANCFGQGHVVDTIDTLGRIQRELFPSKGNEAGAIGYLRKTLQERFGIIDLPEGYFYFPISIGGLELRNTMLEVLALEKVNMPLATYSVEESEQIKRESMNGIDDHNDDYEDDKHAAERSRVIFEDEKIPVGDIFSKRMHHDRKDYALLKEAWDTADASDSDYISKARRHQLPPEARQFMSFEEYAALRCSWLSNWGDSYTKMLQIPSSKQVPQAPNVRAAMERASGSRQWSGMNWYDKWIVSMYGEEVTKKFGGLEAVDPNLIPVGMVELFRSSRMKMDQ